MRILFSSMSAQSHIAPMLPLARTAARAGHDVAFATAPDTGASVQRAGLQALHAGLPFAETQRRHRKVLVGKLFVEAVRAVTNCRASRCTGYGRR